MIISLTNIGKRFNREWIFRNVNYTFTSPKKYAITGPNGSGKSTLLQVIAGAVTHNEGYISLQQETTNDKRATRNEKQETRNEKRQISNDKQETANEKRETRNIKRQTSNDKQETELYKHIAIAAPYLELIEEMTASEFLDFHSSFKPLSISKKEALYIVGLEKATHKQIRYYSSGMKQRLKLAQAFFSKTPILLLDEPTTNLDAEGIALYQHLISNYTAGRLVIISSNDKQEYGFCDEVISIGKYK